ncbi:MAG: hypothetical protein J0I09_14755 [Sphingobacteriia bacterium]|nr:hypothetical protein [Sphingobacteriia bacterium]
MPILIVPFLNREINDSSLSALSGIMDNLQKITLEHTPWKTHSYKPLVHVAVGYAESEIYLKFYVSEQMSRAVNKNSNTLVYEDSCVEFFVMFGNTGYYNLEFNCIGTALVGFGKHKYDRVLLPVSEIEKIKYVVNKEQLSFTGTSYWELTVVIPASLFCYHSIKNFHGLRASGNFYKCGDRMEIPHYVSWSDIISETPNFHLPEYFGDILFGQN